MPDSRLPDSRLPDSAVSSPGSAVSSHVAAVSRPAAFAYPLTAATQTQIQHHALATGFSHGFLVCAAIGLLALIIALAAIRVTREDLSGVDPLAASAD